MATNVQIPALGESISEAVLVKWHKNDGDAVSESEPLAELETDKANVDVPAPAAGVLKRSVKEGTTVKIGETIATIDENATASGDGKAKQAAPVRTPPPKAESKSEDLSPAVRKIVEENKLDPSKIQGSGPGGRITKEDAMKQSPSPVAAPVPTAAAPSAPKPKPAPVPQSEGVGIRRVPMTKIRKRIAENLLSAQQNAAILTTFNEVDLTEVQELRAKYKENFLQTYGVSLGLMSFFARAVIQSLREFKNVNARIEGEDIVYQDFVHLGIAVSTDRGLAVPVLRNAQNLTFAKIELEIKRLAEATREGKLGLDELSGGTFTITNGGIFGSLLSTPILNPPQSGILGMHAIQKRPIVVNDKIEIRPMMYLALSYDHRLVDGRESVSFLVRVKQLLEDPTRLMLEI